MKRLFAALLCSCLLLTATACSEPVAPTTEPSGATTAPTTDLEPTTEPFVVPTITQPMHAIVLPTVKETTKAEDGTVIFSRSYQDVNLILGGSESEQTIAADLSGRMDSTLTGAADVESYAQSDYPLADEYWNPYFVDIAYTPTRIDQSVISLFANHSSYSGGPHPTLITESVTYDLSSGNTLTLTDILSEGYQGSALCDLILQVLAPREAELHYDYKTVLQERFAADLATLTGWYFSGDGLCFHFSPYDIAPYSSGTIIATIPYANLAGVLKPQFLPAEPIEATGSMYAEIFLEEDMERFSFAADVVLDENGTQILLYPDATVADIRIEAGTRYADGSQYVPVSTVFAADSVGLGNAIVITADLSAEAPILRLVYRSGDQEVSAFIVYDADGDSVLLTHG